MCSTVQEQITTCGQNAIVKIGERTNIRPQKTPNNNTHLMVWALMRNRRPDNTCPQATNRYALFWVWDCTQVL